MEKPYVFAPCWEELRDLPGVIRGPDRAIGRCGLWANFFAALDSHLNLKGEKRCNKVFFLSLNQDGSEGRPLDCE